MVKTNKMGFKVILKSIIVIASYVCFNIKLLVLDSTLMESLLVFIVHFTTIYSGDPKSFDNG